MRFALIFSLTSLLVFFSTFAPASNRVGNKASESGESGPILNNKSPCLEEDVYGCQVSGGRFNWSNCTCEYW